MKDIEDRGDHIKISISQSKTEAGIRDVMIVGVEDCQLLREATKRATIVEPSCPENTGRLFPRIALGGYDRHPSHYLAKALEKARKTLDGENSNWDMHSFRRTAVSALVNAGVSREARNLIVGHSNKDDIGISVYRHLCSAQRPAVSNCSVMEPKKLQPRSTAFINHQSQSLIERERNHEA